MFHIFPIYFTNVKNCESPQWLQSRLKAIGLRPISALVDITNYITNDLGRPLHVYDGDKLDGDLTMRFAKENEKCLTRPMFTWNMRLICHHAEGQTLHHN